MDSKKFFFVLLGILVLVVGGAVAVTVLGTKSLAKTGDSLVQLKLEGKAHEKDEESLQRAKRDVEKYAELEKVAKAIVPQEKDQARTVREIVSIARSNGIRIQKISFPSSTLGQKVTPVKGAKPDMTQLTPVEGMTGVFAMPISIESSAEDPIPYSQLLGLLKSFEKNRRTSHITSLTIQPNEDNRNLVSFDLQINAYIKP